MSNVISLYLQAALKELEVDEEDTSPMHVLGQFLKTICESPDLQRFLLKLRSSRRGSISLPRPTHLSITSPAASGIYTPTY